MQVKFLQTLNYQSSNTIFKNLQKRHSIFRCTGYRPILEAYYSFATNQNGTMKAPKEENGLCAMGESCCKNQKKNPNKRVEVYQQTLKLFYKNPIFQKQKLTLFDECAQYDPSQELIFPPELKLHNFHERSFSMCDKDIVWYTPTSFDQLLRLKRRHPKSRFISGNSEVSFGFLQTLIIVFPIQCLAKHSQMITFQLAVELKFRFIDLPIAINPKQVPELRECYLDREKKAVYAGMGLSLSEMKDRLNELIAELPGI